MKEFLQTHEQDDIAVAEHRSHVQSRTTSDRHGGTLVPRHEEGEDLVLRMIAGWCRTREVFERYNIVSEVDLQEAVRRLEDFGHVLDKVGESATSGASKS